MRTLESWPQTLYGRLALDFANALDWRARVAPVETLRDYRDLLRFAVATGTLERPAALRLLAWSRREPAAARRALVSAIRLREAIAAVFQAVARERPIPLDALAILQRAWIAAWGARELRARKGLGAWAWRAADPEPDRLAWAAALDAEALLVAAERPPIRECAGEGCGWLFLDTSRNQSRRWCSMQSCGNRAKVRSFYRRARRRERGAGK